MGYGKGYCEICGKGWGKGRELVELEDGTRMCRKCYETASDEGNIQYCEKCYAQGYDPDYSEYKFVETETLYGAYCPNCYREYALNGEIFPFLPLAQALTPENAKHAPYLHFTGVGTDHSWAARCGRGHITFDHLPEGTEVVDNGFFDSMSGTRNGEYGSFESGLREMVEDVQADRDDWAEGEYLLVLDRASHNVCALSYYLLRRKAQVGALEVA